MLSEEVAVDLPNGILSSGSASVNSVSMMSDEFTSKSDPVEIILINGDELRGCISSNSWYRQCTCPLLSIS